MNRGNRVGVVSLAGLAMLMGVSMAGPMQGHEDDQKPPASKPAASAPAGGVTRIDFDKASPGKLPEGWRIAHTKTPESPAVWQAAADADARSKPNVFKLAKTQNTGGVFNLAVLEKSSHKDLDLRVKLRADSGKEDRGGGLVWRYKDENNYYICRINPLENNYRVYKVVKGKRIQLDSKDVKLESGRWHEVRAIMVGPHVECYLDGKKTLQADDDALKESGAVGLWTKADAASSFDDFEIRASGK